MLPPVECFVWNIAQRVHIPLFLNFFSKISCSKSNLLNNTILPPHRNKEHIAERRHLVFLTIVNNNHSEL